MRAVLLLASMAAVSASCAPEPPAASAPDQGISRDPADRLQAAVGKVQPGMTIDEVKVAIGSPNETLYVRNAGRQTTMYYLGHREKDMRAPDFEPDVAVRVVLCDGRVKATDLLALPAGPEWHTAISGVADAADSGC